MITIPGFEITQELRDGPNSVLYRGRRHRASESDGPDVPIILKVLKREYPTPREVAQFKHEHEIASSLTIGGIIHALDLIKHQNRVVLVLEDFDGESLADILRLHALNLEVTLRIAIRLVEILGDLHASNVIHKDVKPDNIFVNLKRWDVRIGDFGISSRLSRENMRVTSVDRLEGTLAYMSPEQTGRMNRVVDYRSDYYSLGVTLYEMLAGQLPFTGDPMELVHSHIARVPAPPHELNTSIPEPVSEIVMKLLAKTVEKRYQSAAGLKADLTNCLEQWKQSRRVDAFPLGQHDITDRFQIPQRLYGREDEIDTLMSAFDRVSHGATELVLVTGYSGQGKSSLVHEVHRPIVRQRGYFVSGKFDLTQRDVPYASLIQALQDLVRQLLTEGEDRLREWKTDLLGALGVNGDVVVGVIPEIELIIGKQPPIPKLGPTESQNRFSLVFQKLLGVFARREHPLVMFFDDLQWSDSASLRLMKSIVTDIGSAHLLLIGAYRDNEVSPYHSLMLTIDEIREAGVPVHSIAVGPLSEEHVTQLIVDTLHCTVDRAAPLARLAEAKTLGNPFFVGQFLLTLTQEGLLRFDPVERTWLWDLPAIERTAITDNVVELLASKIGRFPDRTLRMLKYAACVGNRFELKTLAEISGQSVNRTAADLWEALVEGIIASRDEAYKLNLASREPAASDAVPSLPPEYFDLTFKFTHDRIQQAAYSLLPEDEKQRVHNLIGRVLLARSDHGGHDELRFDIVKHLNVGLALLTSKEEREHVATLNFEAAMKAKQSAAYEQAVLYLRVARQLLPEDCWATHYDNAFRIAFELGECEYLAGRYEDAEREFNLVLGQARTPLEKARILKTKVILYVNLSKLDEAMQQGMEALKLLGYDIPAHPNMIYAGLFLLRIYLKLRRMKMDDLLSLPEMEAEEPRIAVSVLSDVMPHAYNQSRELSLVVMLKMMDISLRHGLSDASSYAFGSYAIVLAAMNMESKGYAFGDLSLRLAERLNSMLFLGKMNMGMATAINHWTHHARTNLQYTDAAARHSVASGDLLYVTYAYMTEIWTLLLIGRPLDAVHAKAQQFLDYTTSIKYDDQTFFHIATQRFVLAMQGRTKDHRSFSDASWDEVAFARRLGDSRYTSARIWFLTLKMTALYHFGAYEDAWQLAQEIESLKHAMVGLLVGPEFVMYRALTAAALYSKSTGAARRKYKSVMRKSLKRMRHWTEGCPENYEHKERLIAAEYTRVTGDPERAAALYDAAITAARENEYVQNEALANELAAHWALALGREITARKYMAEARYAYVRWGAAGKVKAIDVEHSALLSETEDNTKGPMQAGLTTVLASSANLDLMTVIKASQALSGEIVLDKLVSKLMDIVIENAGARRGFLALEQDGRLIIQAEGSVEEPMVTSLLSTPVAGCGVLPESVVQYVARTRSAVLLPDASEDDRFGSDPFVVAHNPKSVLCLPVVAQGKLVGVIYLENRLTTSAFTPERLEVLRILASQAAVSITNARLYANLEQTNEAYRKFVPREFLSFLNHDDIVKVRLGDQVQKDMTVFFTDIWSFTTLSERMTPKENFDFLNSILRVMGPIIRRNGGFIDKYIGDAIMALFPDRVDDAVRAAVGMRQALAAFSAERKTHGLPPVHMGIGIHRGSLMLGTIGEEERMEGTVISDAVNLASRIEGMTRMYGTGILVSQQAHSQLDDPHAFQWRIIDRVRVKGKKEVVEVWENLDGDDPETRRKKLAGLESFNRAIAAYQARRFDEALVEFERAAAACPEDGVARLYVERARTYSTTPVPEDWTGVATLESK